LSVTESDQIENVKAPYRRA